MPRKKNHRKEIQAKNRAQVAKAPGAKTAPKVGIIAHHGSSGAAIAILAASFLRNSPKSNYPLIEPKQSNQIKIGLKMTDQIKVKLNPDVAPNGSDLAVVNAARRSFNTRSSWANEDDLWVGVKVPVGPCGDLVYEKVRTPYVGPILKEKDKRLLEFLARGMTAVDFEALRENLFDDVWDIFEWEGERNVESEVESFVKELWRWRNTPIHDTPFNHCFISFEVQAPIFVARHLVKTEYTIFSEFSRRYITDEVEFYNHTYRKKAEDKKQGSGGPHEYREHWQKQAGIANLRQLELYEAMVADSISPEQARGQLPQDLMTSWTWSGTLGAFAKMCRERLGNDAQYETSLVAEQVYRHLLKYYPVSAKALVKGV